MGNAIDSAILGKDNLLSMVNVSHVQIQIVLTVQVM